jgi:acyl-CoA-binding protein
MSNNSNQQQHDVKNLQAAPSNSSIQHVIAFSADAAVAQTSRPAHFRLYVPASTTAAAAWQEEPC